MRFISDVVDCASIARSDHFETYLRRNPFEIVILIMTESEFAFSKFIFINTTTMESSSVSDASSPPWQYKWKNPHYWEIPSAFGSLPTIDHAAAEVNEDCILSVTLLGDDAVADRLCLSLIRTDTKTIDRSRTLQWPTQRIVSKQKKDDSKAIVNKSGLVSVHLMRLPKRGDELNWEDAMDVLNFLSLDANAMSLRNVTKDGEVKEEPTTASNDIEDVASSPPVPVSKEDSSELFLACLTNKGKLHVYSPMELLDGAPEDHAKVAVPPQMESAMTHFMFGQDLYDTLQTSVLPMSQPKYSVQLSLVGNVEESWVWDPTIERSTRPFYESGGGPMNATIIVQCLDYVAIIGSNDFMGFVTFVSTSTWTEKRTLFIPMPIDSAEAIQWGALSVLVLTGGEMCLAVALNSMAVGRGQVLHADDPLGADATALLPIQRFQILLVQVPNGKCTLRNGSPPTCVVAQTEYEDLSYFEWTTIDTTTATPGAFFDYHVGTSTPTSASMVIINTQLKGRAPAKADASFLGSGYTVIAKPTLPDGRPGGIEYVGWEGGTFRLPLAKISVKSMTAVVPLTTGTVTNAEKLVDDEEGDDEKATVQQAIESISIESFQQRRSSSSSSPLSSKKTSFSLHEKSRRLLKQISTESNPYSKDMNAVSLVTNDGTLGWVSVRASPEPVPFRAVTAWLCNESEFFVAASLALLQHPESNSLFLRKIWRNQPHRDISVLDGISHEENRQIASDMVVTCLLNGGHAETLEAFLNGNQDYLPGKACIQLASAGVRMVDENRSDLWPLRCLLGVGSARDFLEPSLQLLNAALPDELRDGSSVCKELVSWIASADAVDLLFDLTEEKSRERYWMSLGSQTRQDISVLAIKDVYPLLLFPEVRSWCIKDLSQCIDMEKSLSRPTDSLPTPWLISLVQACMRNAGCKENWDQEASVDITEAVRKSLYPAAGSGGLDFGLVIPALLLLAGRRIDSMDSRSIRSLLNAACYLAGRTKETPRFALDSSLLMRHCTTMEDVEAAANLIGGQNGLVLECCHILMLDIGLNMEEAEQYLLSNSYQLPRDSRDVIESFEYGESQRRLTRLLQEHVLSIRTYGEFETSQIRGRVDPVFATTLCLKTWWTISAENLSEATPWLIRFLRQHLCIDGDSVSPHKLVCAALTRALIWPEEKDGTSGELLASKLQLDSLFLFQLAQGCCGLVESLPPYVYDNGRVSPSPFAPKGTDTFDESFLTANGSFLENEGSFRSL